MKIFVTAKPRSREQQVIPLDAKHFRVAVKEMPIGGEANDAVCRAIAEYFDVAPSQVQVVSGHTSKNKIIEII